MALADFIRSLDDLESQAVAAFREATDNDGLEEVRIRFLGAKNGQLKSVQQQMSSVDGPDKKAAGMRLNAAKGNIQASFEQAVEQLSQRAQKSGPAPDPTLPGNPVRLGHVHPVTQTIEHLKEIMGRMGFEVVEGPEVEDPWHNFVALNIPEDHPARDPLDNFYLATAERNGSGKTYAEGDRLLRSQTSTVQIRVMENRQPPIRVISLGRVYRPDEADATHYPMFHQMEGLLIDRGVTMANLKTVLNMFATSYLGEEVKVRFRPSFFPFTEPSVEVDYWWNGSWIEFGGAGMVDPAVLTAVGYDPEEVTGFAFGLGVERLCMRRHAVTDIRDLFSGDIRFLSQF
ncbi:Phenylalanine--tRNA ligase alpha subunit [Rosistilla oblonga]|uniref:Phenylalanine--tRNA ligase alpha subunit n=3 Tax=Rosistilla TaxID=2795779 RepID=A0A518IRC3_9BACT|nr:MULTISPECIES: phenylalanine--tRNA ligase subunit alpha [Rosistilla]QDS87154.1 Phenylalanine--tRNA ligase alpha subunit [Rosistilla ulvae]QDV11658.1 Phenylalanine--tRNA ligase alpha subunit [Rosistilla oblonga]QDV55647.1 Phenylalanine--tRNA ligase alpha subunit [Rosistilla oblonga]QDV68187.1 Phenylalanine--tRNA ligase alpha subunit [Rosistilla carotiformis]